MPTPAEIERGHSFAYPGHLFAFLDAERRDSVDAFKRVMSGGSLNTPRATPAPSAADEHDVDPTSRVPVEPLWHPHPWVLPLPQAFASTDGTNITTNATRSFTTTMIMKRGARGRPQRASLQPRSRICRHQLPAYESIADHALAAPTLIQCIFPNEPRRGLDVILSI